MRKIWEWILSWWRKPTALPAAAKEEEPIPAIATVAITPEPAAVLVAEAPAAAELPVVTEAPVLSIAAPPDPVAVVAPVSAISAALSKVEPRLAEKKELVRNEATLEHRTSAATLLSSYFTPGAYSPSAPGARLLLAPDLAFLLSHSNSTPVVPRLVEASAVVRTPFLSASVIAIDPVYLTCCILEREGSPHVPVEATAECLRPEWIAWGIRLRDQVVENWQTGGRPLEARELYQEALGVGADPAVALLLCFVVTRSFARGGEAVRWEVVDRSCGLYTDGVRSLEAAITHRAGVLASGPLGLPSIFYVLFAASEFGVADPGDWYRYFASAMAACFAALNRATIQGTIREIATAPAWAGALLQLVQSAAEETKHDPAHFGWLWANAVALADVGIWSRSGGTAREASEAPRRGALFGLEAAGATLEPCWGWQGVNQPGPLDPTPVAKLYAKPRFSAGSITQILETRSPHIRMEGRNAVFQLLFSVEESIACRFLSARWRDTLLPRQVTAAIVDDLGWKLVEHAVRRQTIVRCTLPPSGPAVCEIDCGDGFKRIEGCVASGRSGGLVA